MKMITLMLGLSLFTQLHARPEKGFKEKKDFFTKELGLSEDQLKKVTEIRQSNHAKMKEDRAKFKELKKAFNEAMKNPKSTSSELKAKFDSFQKARDDFQRQRFEKMLKLREVLKPDQLAKFQELKKERKPKWNERKKMKHKD